MTAKTTYQLTRKQNREISETVDRERGKLLGFIRNRVPTDEDAQDVMQDVFFQFTRMYRNLESIEKTTSWLYRVARNRITDLYRKKKERSIEDQFGGARTDEDLYLEELLPIVNTDTPEDSFTREVIMEVINEGLEELPEKQRTVFIQHELEGRSFNEISSETGVSRPTLITRKRYAVLHLREKLQELFNEMNTL